MTENIYPNEQAPGIIAVEMIPDTPERLISDLCDYLDMLHQCYVLPDQFKGISKQEVITVLTAALEDGQFDSPVNILSDVAETSGIPTPDIFIDRVVALREQWDKKLTYQLETSIVDKDSGYITAHLPVNGELKSRGIIISGDLELCRHLFQRLTDGSITAQQARDLERYQKEHRILLYVEDLYPRNQRKPQTARRREYAR